MRTDRKSMFTIRVYGIYLKDLGSDPAVLVADEIIRGRRITKFPGGGLEYGEGLKECLVREIREELDAEAIDLQHLYTTDHFQQSTFHSEPMQVISVYYMIDLREPEKIKLMNSPFGYEEPEQREGFRMLLLRDAKPHDISLPIDRIVLGMLQERYGRAQI